MRICFARKADDLREATRRLTTWLASCSQPVNDDRGSRLSSPCSRHHCPERGRWHPGSRASDLPAGWVAGGLLAVAIASLAGVNTAFPSVLQAPVFLVIGISSGSGVSQETLHQMRTWPGSFVILGIALVAMIASSSWWLQRRCGWSRGDALLASLPGALTLVIAVGEGLKADMKKVAISQSLRVVILVEPIPLLALAIGHPPNLPLLAEPATISPPDLALLVACGAALGLVLQWLKFPGAWIVGGLTASAGFYLNGWVEGRFPVISSSSGLSRSQH